MTFKMNSPEGKTILAKARGGDFAHPGEEEAIVLMASGLKRESIRRVLDVGCGRGGTAAWFQRNDWGQIVAIDIDQASINYAQHTYPEIEFLTLDVAGIAKWRPEQFDFVYLLNSFYAFPDQRLALENITSVCRPGASLCIFDYAKSRRAILPASLGSDIGQPIITEDMPIWLDEAGWNSVTLEDCTDQYVFWYDNLLRAFQRDEKWICENFGDDWRRYVIEWYGSLRKALIAGDLQGVLYKASRAKD